MPRCWEGQMLRPLGRRPAGPRNVQWRRIVPLSNPTPGSLHERTASTFTQTSVHTHSGQHFHHSQKEETTQGSTNLQMDKCIVLHACNELLFGQKEEGSTDSCYNTDEPGKHYSEKTNTKGHMLYPFTGNVQSGHMGRENRSAFAWGSGEGQWEVTANGHGVPFMGDENVLELDSGDSGKTCGHNQNH